MPGTLAPTGVRTVFDINGNPVSGAKIYTYLAGTTTPTITWSDYALTTPNTNPIIADTAGRFVAYLQAGGLYKFLYKTAADVTLYTEDNIPSTPTASGNVDLAGVAGEVINAFETAYLSDGSGGKTAGQWFKTDADFPYASTNPVVAMALAAVAMGATGLFRLRGSVTVAGSLTTGARYFLSGTPGVITTVAPATNPRFVGQADTVSSLILDSAPPPLIVGPLNLGTTGQIVFPAAQAPSADPNTLDDWEEQSWTPSLVSASGAATYSTQQGGYVKKGCEVTAWFNIGLSSKGTLAGAYLLLAGLPFPANTVRGSCVVSYFEALATSWVTIGGFVDPPNQTAQLFGSSAPAVSRVALSAADIGNTSTLIGLISYRTTT